MVETNQGREQVTSGAVGIQAVYNEVLRDYHEKAGEDGSDKAQYKTGNERYRDYAGCI